MTENDLREVRAAKNELLFRQVNERLVELNQRFASLEDRSVFVCECARLDCMQEIDMTLDEYERARANSKRFIVAPSDEHVLPDLELVAERHETYFVVEKIGVAGQVAESAAPAADVQAWPPRPAGVETGGSRAYSSGPDDASAERAGEDRSRCRGSQTAVGS